CHSGSVWIEATQAMARSRAASFMGIPTQSPSSVFPVLSSSRTGVHSPERSMPRAVVFTSSCCAWLRRPPAPNSAAASTPARINARGIWCIRSSLPRLPADVTIERRGRKGRKVRQDFSAAFAAFAFYGGVTQSDTLLEHVFDPELQDPRIARRENLPERRARQ